MSTAVDFGIDLGTTNSTIAKYDNGEVRIFKNRDQMEVTPSVVRIEKTGRIMVGRRAYQSLLSDGDDNTAAEFKRWMGQSYTKDFLLAGRSLTPEQLSAENLKSLLDDARRQTDQVITEAVITVPAAFGQLQCEATSRAATMAGLTYSTLLQEPIAASIAYGMKPDFHEKRWLVYDFGGGTIDVAAISTKGGRLGVLEHQGDNHLGGKDFDRLIVQQILWPRLQERFNLRSVERNGRYSKLMQVLKGKAEEAKIDLSSMDSVPVSIIDVGEDDDGTPIETEIDVTVQDINRLAQPIVEKTVDICRDVLKRCGMGPADLAAIVLVGGPTQMPCVRSALQQAFTAPLELSIDPMTVVARGAAIYASTVESRTASAKHVETGAISVNVVHEKVWPETTCFVAGTIGDGERIFHGLEVLIDTETGHWNSGWMPVRDGYLEANVHLLKDKVNKFWIYARDKSGNKIDVSPDNFSIRHGLVIMEPLLPHSIGAEVVESDGSSSVDVVFSRSTPLPAKVVKAYKAERTLQPGQDNQILAIKLWEGESPLPDENTIVGVLCIRSTEITRAIPQGSDIEVQISVDASRRLRVQAFVPILNKIFEDQVYVPQDNYPDYESAVRSLSSETEEHFTRIKEARELAKKVRDDKAEGELARLASKAEALQSEQEQIQSRKSVDPDDAKRIVQESKEIKRSISRIGHDVRANNALLIGLDALQEEKTDAEEVGNGEGQSRRSSLSF